MSLVVGLIVVSAETRVPGPANAAAAAAGFRARQSLANFDIRHDTIVGVSAAQAQASAALGASGADRPIIEFSERTGGVSRMFRSGGYLSTGSAGSGGQVLNGFLADNQDVLGLGAAALATFLPLRQDIDQAGVTHVYFEQRINGLQVFGTVLKGHVDMLGRVISVEGDYYPPAAAVTGTALVSADGALATALKWTLPDVLATVSGPRGSPQSADGLTAVPGHGFPYVLEPESGPDRLTVFEKGPFGAPLRVRQVLFPTSTGSQLAWQVEISAPAQHAYFVVVVDAQSGTLLYRANTARTAEPPLPTPLASVFPKSPDASPVILGNYFGDTTLSPQGWSSDQATFGNNVQSMSATSTGDFVFPFTDAWKNTGANAFDLTNMRVRFTPTDAQADGYSSTVAAAAAITPGALDLFASLSNGDNGHAAVTCTGFDIHVLGSDYATVYVNTNGSVSFGGGIDTAAPTKSGLSMDYPRVAGLWRDLIVTSTGQLTSDCVSEGSGMTLRIAWTGVKNAADATTNTFMITMHGTNSGLDGVIDLDYGSVAPLDELIGIGGSTGLPFDPASSGVVSYRDLSAPSSPGIAGGLAQAFPDPDLNFSATNLGYHLNALHDLFYRLGFTEAAGNYQLLNFGLGGQGGDPIIGEAQIMAGGADDAFVTTSPDGRPSILRFGLRDDGAGCRRDEALDATLIYHEYTHGVTQRMVAGPSIITSMLSFQGASLSEGWSDAVAITSFNDPLVGGYVSCNYVTGLRSAAYNRHPGTYADFANKGDLGLPAGGIGTIYGVEPHRDGEIWAATAWDIKAAVGAAVTQQLLVDALRYLAADPSMIDARDAMLTADQVDFGGSHLTTLWTIFARRGLGASASASPGTFVEFVPSSADGWRSTVFAAYDMPSARYSPVPVSTPFSDSFEGANNWVVAGSDGNGGGALWHLSTLRAADGTHAFYYGKEATHNYDTGFRNYGTLTSPTIALPALATGQTLALEWDHYRVTQDSFGYDAGVARIIDLTVGTTTQVAFAGNTLDLSGLIAPTNNASFQHQKVNVQAFAGHNVQIQFYMDTGDAQYNSAEGWFVDNVRVLVYGSSASATVTTAAASGVFSRGATLNGTGNPNGAATAAYFEYGPTTAYGSTTPQVTLGAGTSALAIGGGLLVGLTCNTTYHFRAVAVNSAGLSDGADQTFTTTAAPCRSIVDDIDLDGRSDLVVFRKSTGTWLTLMSAGNYTNADAVVWGESTDSPLSGDYDGDGRTDRAVFRPADGTWHIALSSTNFTTSLVVQWGTAGDIPLEGDLDGDGRADMVVWRPSEGRFYWLSSSSGYSYVGAQAIQWGNAALGDTPMVADMDGDGRADLVVWRSSTGTFYWLTSTTGYDPASSRHVQWGNVSLGDQPMLGDMDGDGLADPVVWRSTTGTWYWLKSTGSYNPASAGSKQFGQSTDTPLLMDMDGDGIMDLVAWRPSTGVWYWLTSTTNFNYVNARSIQWGSSAFGDVPVAK